jgi:nucleoside-diphosphate-sugar epimerase
VTSLDLAEFDYPDVRGEIREVRGDVRDPEAVRRALEGARLVVHAAAALPLYTPRDIVTTEVDGTRTVLEGALAAGVERVVHISSTAVYGIPDHHPLREEDPLRGVGPYGEAKVEAEAVCLRYRARGLCVPILRPKSFVGPERLGVFALLYDWAQDGRGFPVLGPGTNRYQLLDVEDLCEAIHLVLTLPADRVNDTFNIGAGEFGTIRQDYQAVLDRAGFGKRVVPLPARPAIWALRLLEWLRLSPLYRWVYETAGEDSFVAIDRAERVLGWRPRHSNRDALLRNFEWYLANRARFQHRAGVSHRVPWKQGILRLARHLF